MVVVQHVITSLTTGGAEMMLCRLVEQPSATYRHRIIALCSGGSLRERLRAARIETADLGLERGQVSPAAGFRLRRELRRERPRIVQGWMHHGNLAATFANLLDDRQRPHIWVIQQSLDHFSNDKRMTRALVRLAARLSRLPRAIVYCSRRGAEQHERAGFDASRTVVIPNGVDCREFHPNPGAGERLRAELGVAPEVTLVGMLARLHPMKDHRNLIDAMARLVARGHDVHLVLGGTDTDTDPGLTTMLADAGLASRGHRLGERCDVAPIMAGLDILATPSAWGEAFPVAISEAMASGVPCVATDLGDCAWLIGETGTIVPRRDSDALAGALERLISLGPEGRRRLGRAARDRILEHFTVEAVAASYEALYERLLAAPAEAKAAA